MLDPLPILYSFRRCPYAIRTRMAMASLGLNCVVREVELRNKPQALIDISAKATVPVLVSPSEGVIDESLAIICWAVEKSSSLHQWTTQELDDPLVHLNDNEFKFHLDRYKYPQRYESSQPLNHFAECANFLARLESTLCEKAKSSIRHLKSSHSAGDYFLRTPELSLLDIVIFPFVRQFYFVDVSAFESLNLPRLSRWLRYNLANEAFTRVMQKRANWQEHVPQKISLLFDE